jgi:hypothetical protein
MLKTTTRRTTAILPVLAMMVALNASSPCGAATLTYTDQALASGSLGDSTFTSVLVTVKFVGDTTNVAASPGFYSSTAGEATVDIAGLGTATFLSTSIDVFDNQFFTPVAAAGIGDLALGVSILDTFNAAFSTYDLTSVIGPLSGPSFIRPDITFATDRGGFNLITAGNSTFTSSAAPEPGTLSLLCMGLTLVVVGVLRPRSSSRSPE